MNQSYNERAKVVSMCRSLICTSVLLLAPFFAYAEVRDVGEVDKTGMLRIWQQAINGNDGLVIKAELVGEMAQKIQESTGSPGPFKALVSRVKKYNEPGCARIRIAYLFPNAKTVDGGRRDADIKYEQNFCLDGHIPRETVDLTTLPGR